MERLIPLKAKYRLPSRLLRRGSAWSQPGGFVDPHPDGTLVFNAGRFKSKSSNSGSGAKNKPLSLIPRRRSYNTHFTEGKAARV